MDATREETSAGEPLAHLFEPYVWRWFAETFREPSPPQATAWPCIARGQNTLILSPTGSGKTLAAFLWCLNQCYAMGRRGELEDATYVLYVSPLKALNNDIQRNLREPLVGIQKEAEEMGLDLPRVRSAVRTGDTTSSQRARMSRRPPHILITTPESLFIILATERFRESLRGIRYVIVDEIHAIADNKRGTHLALSLERLGQLVREGKQAAGEPDDGSDPFVRIGLSATQRPLEEIARFLTGVDDAGAPRPCQIVDAGGRKELDVRVLAPVEDLSEAQFDAIWSSAYDQMLSMIREHETTLIFCNSRYKTERTALRLNEMAADGDGDMVVGAHHGSMSKEVRLDMEERLKRGELDALVATSSLELGIDVGSIDLVCQIQSPKSVSSGMQRIGRAGHLLDVTSKGRLLVSDRDDLVESAVLVRAILDGRIDTTRIPCNCLDVLAQHIVGAVAADPWEAGALYDLLRHAYPFRSLPRDDYDRVLDMLAGNHVLDMEYAPYPKITWDKVNDKLYPERGARLISFQASGTIPDVADYEVYFADRKTRVGTLDEEFVENLRPGSIFILGSSSWRVLGIQRNRVLVEDVYGQAPTVPFWLGDRASRTYDLGVQVGAFRGEMAARLADGDNAEAWLEREYYVNPYGARALLGYFREQLAVAGEVPTHRLLVVESFSDEMGQRHWVLHSPFGIRVNDPWAMALQQAIEDRHGFRVQTATHDDGILITLPKVDEGTGITPETLAELSPGDLPRLVGPAELDEIVERAVLHSPLFVSRFRHNAVRSLLVLRAYKGSRTPVWLQSLRSSALMEAIEKDSEFPVVQETLRECLHESLDVPNLRLVLEGLHQGEITWNHVESQIPSPFTHSLLLLGQYGEMGDIPARERKTRLLHLHREILRQILDEETLAHLLDEEAVAEVEARLQRTWPRRRARDAIELGRILVELGDLVEAPDDELGLAARAEEDWRAMLAELVAQGRAVQVPITTAETNRKRWIATENYGLYRAAFAVTPQIDPERQQAILDALGDGAPGAWGQIPGATLGELEALVDAYQIVRLPDEEGPTYGAADAWIPAGFLTDPRSRQAARLELVRRHLRYHGPTTRYEIMERYGFPDAWVHQALEGLRLENDIVRGEYVATKSFPQWSVRSNLEEIHRLTLNRLRKEMEPATPEEYTDFLLRWQHLHPETRLSGLDGLRQLIAQLEGLETFQAVWERDVFRARLADYRPEMLDQLCRRGEAVWRRFERRRMRRGQIAFALRRDLPWLVPHPETVNMGLRGWDNDIADEIDRVRAHLVEHGASYFDDIVEGTGLDWRLVLRAVWALLWVGESSNDDYASIRYASFTSGLSACYDLFKKPSSKGVTLDYIVDHMLELRHLDPRTGRWAPTERLRPEALAGRDEDEAAANWARLLLARYGFVTREMAKNEGASPDWAALRRGLVRLELLGEARKGYFVEGLSGEQYAAPEAIQALRAAKLERAHLDASDLAREPMILLNLCDPACPFNALFPLANASGDEYSGLGNPHRYLVLQAGEPILYFHDAVTLLTDLSAERAEDALLTLMSIIDKPPPIDPYAEINVRDWNGHPSDVSPARGLLTQLGFIHVGTRHKGHVYNGKDGPDWDALPAEDLHVPEQFDHDGKEKAPVAYDAAWIISRADPEIRNRVAEMISVLQAEAPQEAVFQYGPRGMVVRYRGMRLANPHIMKTKIRLQIKPWGWDPGLMIEPNTDVRGEDFVAQVRQRLARCRRQIDERMDQNRQA